MVLNKWYESKQYVQRIYIESHLNKIKQVWESVKSLKQNCSISGQWMSPLKLLKTVRTLH